MEIIDAWLQKPVINMVAAAFVGWLVTKWLDRRSNKAPVLVAVSSPVPASAGGLTADDVERAFARALKRSSQRASQDAESASMIFALGIFIAAACAVVIYGEVAIETARFVVVATGASAITLAVQGYKSGLFEDGENWAAKILLTLLICCACLATLDQAQETVAATITRAQRQGWHIRSVPEFFQTFGFWTSWAILHASLALVLVAGVSIMALVAQLSMVLNASVARSSVRGWRRGLWRGLQDRSSATVFCVMIISSALAFALSSGWLLHVMGR